MIHISKDLKTIEDQVKHIKAEYQETIKAAVQQNPDIIVMSTSPRCFIVPFSKLSIESWSPEYYDFELQASILVAAIKQLRIDKLSKYLSHIIEHGQLPKIKIADNDTVLYSGTYDFKIHPKVVDKLKEIIV